MLISKRTFSNTDGDEAERTMFKVTNFFRKLELGISFLIGIVGRGLGCVVIRRQPWTDTLISPTLIFDQESRFRRLRLASGLDPQRVRPTVGFPALQFNTAKKQFVATRKLPIPVSKG